MNALPIESLFKAMPPALLIQPDAPVFTLAHANEAFLRLTGFQADDILGKSIFDIFSNNPSSEGPVNKLLLDAITWVIENKKPHVLPALRYDIPIRGTKIFKKKYWVANHSPLLDAEGNLKYICQTVMDTTRVVRLIKEERTTLQVTEAKRRLLYSLFMQAPVGIGVFLGENFIVDLVNPNLAKLYGKAPEELLGKPIFDVLTTAKGIGFEQQLDNVLATGQPYLGTEAMLPLMRNGQLENIYANFVYEPFRDENDQIIGVVAIALDVTKEVVTNRKLQASEQRLNMALQNSAAGVFDTNVLTGLTLHSSRNAQIFGYSDNQEEWSIDKFMEHVHPDDRNRIRLEYQKSLQHGNVDLTMRIRRADGVTRWINVIGKHIYNQSGQAVRCVGTTTDITEKKDLERQKDQFISMVSHELKTPLTSIKAYGDLIGLSLKDGATKKNLDFLSRMQAQITRLELLIKDLLEVSRMENGKLLLNRSSFEMNEMLSELVSDLQLANPSHKLIIVQNDPATVFADRDKLIQVVTNLISNAVKYSPKADKIHISLTCLNEQIICSIQDFGIGISKDKHSSVFERFQQVGEAEQYSGLGLGLYICKEIIHAEGGSIWLESVLGKGSIFYFTLPADKTLCGPS